MIYDRNVSPVLGTTSGGSGVFSESGMEVEVKWTYLPRKRNGTGFMVSSKSPPFDTSLNFRGGLSIVG